MAFLVRLANIRYVGKYPLFDSNLDERRDERRHELHCAPDISDLLFAEQGMESTLERRAWRDLDVVAQLEILHEGSGLGERLHAVGLEDEVGERFAGQKRAGYDLRE